MKHRKIILSFMVVSILILVGCSGAGKNKFGPYGSTHIHADFKVYILGKPLNFNNPKYQVMEDLTHVENNDGDVLHVHATGITLGYFLKSLGIRLTDQCITLDTSNEYCNLEKATLNVYLKNQDRVWEQLYNAPDYVINDLDKILVSYGSEDEEGIREQLESVTDKAAIT